MSLNPSLRHLKWMISDIFILKTIIHIYTHSIFILLIPFSIYSDALKFICALMFSFLCTWIFPTYLEPSFETSPLLLDYTSLTYTSDSVSSTLKSFWLSLWMITFFRTFSHSLQHIYAPPLPVNFLRHPRHLILARTLQSTSDCASCIRWVKGTWKPWIDIN